MLSHYLNLVGYALELEVVEILGDINKVADLKG